MKKERKNKYQQLKIPIDLIMIKERTKVILPVTGFPLGSVTGTATGATVVTSWVTGFPFPS